MSSRFPSESSSMFETVSLAALAAATGGLITQCGMRRDTKKWGCITYGYDQLGRYYDSSEGGYAATPPPPGMPAGTKRRR